MEQQSPISYLYFLIVATFFAIIGAIMLIFYNRLTDIDNRSIKAAAHIKTIEFLQEDVKDHETRLRQLERGK